MVLLIRLRLKFVPEESKLGRISSNATADILPNLFCSPMKGLVERLELEPKLIVEVLSPNIIKPGDIQGKPNSVILNRLQILNLRITRSVQRDAWIGQMGKHKGLDYMDFRPSLSPTESP